MTADITPDNAAREYLICKHGLYYAPNSQGYTGIRDLAGRYTLEEARSISHPNGPEGPRDGIDYVHESKAPEFSAKCFDDLKVKHLLKQRDELAARLAEVEAGLSEPLEHWINDAFLQRRRAEAAEAKLAALQNVVSGLVAILDRNSGKGPIPDVEMMFCWLAAQDVRATWAKIKEASK